MILQTKYTLSLAIAFISFKSHAAIPQYSCTTFIYGINGVESSRNTECHITSWIYEISDHDLLRELEGYRNGLYNFTPNVYINNEEEVSRDEMIAQCVAQSNSFSSDCNRWVSYGGSTTAALAYNKLGGRKR